MRPLSLCLKSLRETFGFGLIASTFANSSVIYDNGVAVGDSGRCAETSGICVGAWTIFDDFSLSVDSQISSISWTANFYSGLSDYNSSNIWIYDNDPVFNDGNMLFSANVAGTLVASSLGGNFYEITVSLAEILDAGTYC